jgi:hypothetical protein
MGEASSAHGIDEKCVNNFGVPEGNIPLEEPRRGWEDNIKLKAISSFKKLVTTYRKTQHHSPEVRDRQ